MTLKLLRLNPVLERTANSRSTHYNSIHEGTMVPPILISARAAAYPAEEIDAIVAARIAGRTTDEIRALVRELIAKRQSLAPPGADTRTPKQSRHTQPIASRQEDGHA